MLLQGAGARARGFPDRAVRTIVPSPTGGGSDIIARIEFAHSDRVAKKHGIKPVD